MWTTTWSQSHKGLACFPRNDLNYSVQYALPIHHAGSAIRLRFSNFYGEHHLAIRNVTVKTSENEHILKFSQNKGFTLEPGCDILSDALELNVLQESTLYLTIDYKNDTIEKRPLSGGLETLGAHRLNQESPWTADSFPQDSEANLLTEWYESMPGKHILTISSLEVQTLENDGCIVAFGDSITEQSHWFTPFAEKMHRTYPQKFGVVNAGISGNRLLRSNQRAPKRAQVFGLSGMERFLHDVFEVNTHVAHIIFALGLNDLYQPGNSENTALAELPQAEDLIHAYQQAITLAHEKGAKIYLTTLTPFDGASLNTEMTAKETIRTTVNTWIRSQKDSDGFIDFDEAVSNQQKLQPDFDSGDHLHPNAKGGQAMAEAIDLNLFL